MELFNLGVLLHSSVGTVALASFWTAALARKGSRVHRTAGKILLLSLIGVMTFATLQVAARLQTGNLAGALLYLFLISLVATACWLTWFSVRHQRDPARLTGAVYRTLASWLVIVGAIVFSTGVATERPLTMFLALLGLGFGANMWRLALKPASGPQWWRAHHMNGAMMNFIACHDSFLTIGLASVLPEIRQPYPRMTVAVTVTVVAIVLRVWLARHEPARQHFASRPAAH